ncbi:MAG: hypothetical protein Q9160_006066 [Pyrenula sp. 1 TL-2023]
MPTYTILGSTGNIGLNILRECGRRQQQASNSSSGNNDANAIHVNAYARSKSKLLSLHPEASSNPHLTIHEGALEDLDLLTTCLTGAEAVFLTVAVSDNIPSCSVAQNTARLVVEALERLRSKDRSYRAPLLIVLSSSSISERLWRGEGMPPAIHSMILKAASHVYRDLEVAEEFLRTYRGNEKGDLFSLTFVKPGGLVHDSQKGFVLSTEASKTFTSFEDCAAGMVEIAMENEGGRWTKGEEVSVNSARPKGADVSFSEGLALLRALVKGLLYHFFPGAYRWV